MPALPGVECASSFAGSARMQTARPSTWSGRRGTRLATCGGNRVHPGFARRSESARVYHAITVVLNTVDRRARIICILRESPSFRHTSPGWFRQTTNEAAKAHRPLASLSARTLRRMTANFPLKQTCRRPSAHPGWTFVSNEKDPCQEEIGCICPERRPDPAATRWWIKKALGWSAFIFKGQRRGTQPSHSTRPP